MKLTARTTQRHLTARNTTIPLRSLLLSLICSFFFSPAGAQTGSWRAYMAYYEPQQIVKAGADHLFVRASNGLYSYNLNDHSITTYDKVQQLNDTHINIIAWNSTANRLIAVYDNSNIDLIDLDGNVTNISSLRNKSMTQDKTVNAVVINQQYAYLATGFGVMKVNMQRGEVAETYILNHNVTDLGIDQQTLYIKTRDTYTVAPETDPATLAEGTVASTSYTYDNSNPPKAVSKTVVITGAYQGSISSNLIDPHQWTYVTTTPSAAFTKDNSAWNDYQAVVATLQPGGPKYNNFGFLTINNRKLYTASGGGTSYTMPGTIQVFDGSEWTFLQDDMTGVPGTDARLWEFVNSYAVAIDPADSKHIYVAGRTGLFEYYDGALQNYFNKDNSILQTATSSNRFVLVTGMTYDTEGNLWLLQSQVTENSILEITKDGEWVKHPQSLLMDGGKSLNNLTGLFQDSRGLMWFVNAHWSKPSFYCYNPRTDNIVSYMVTLVNQDGTSAPESYNPHCIAEDLDGNIWIGTAYGPYLIEADRVGQTLDYATQVKVPRNDGTNYADYLLADVNITCMAIDGANRKWFGTNGSGIYLISADNMEQLLNFTTSNSPLLSNNITAVTVDNRTGEVFIGTDQGLCSYMSDATEAAIDMVKDDVYAYPNPVVPGYDGLITIVGLSFDADVKILTTSGQLVAQGRSNGGTFTWNGRDRQGRHVASGIYMVAAATSEGKKGTVCKIAVIR